MVTLHIHKPADQLTSWDTFASQEDLYVRSEMVCSFLQGKGSLPKQLSADLFSGDIPFCLLAPKGYLWANRDPVILFTFSAERLADADPGTILWALHLLEDKGVPVFLIPLPTEGEGCSKPVLYRNVELLEQTVPAMVRKNPYTMICHGKTFYEGLLLLMRDRNRKRALLPKEVSLVSLFGGDAFCSSSENITDRSELREHMQELAHRISVIALTNDRRVPAARILRSWVNDDGEVDACIDLIKPAFPAQQGIFPSDGELFQGEEDSGDASVLQKTRYQMQLRLEASRMICRLLSRHTTELRPRTYHP